jgi:hypothetical protein
MDLTEKMPRYRKLLVDLIEEQGLRPSARLLRVNPQSLSDWATGTEPRLDALEKISRHFFIPVPALLMPQGDSSEWDERIISALPRLDIAQKRQVVDLITRLLSSSGAEAENA